MSPDSVDRREAERRRLGLPKGIRCPTRMAFPLMSITENWRNPEPGVEGRRLVEVQHGEDGNRSFDGRGGSPIRGRRAHVEQAATTTRRARLPMSSIVGPLTYRTCG